LIKKSEVFWDGYSKEEQQFVIAQKQQLVSAYEEHMGV
jgi:hypothetical protein